MDDPFNSQMRKIWGEDFAGYEFQSDSQAGVFMDISFFLVANPSYIVNGTSFTYDEDLQKHVATVVVSTGLNKRAFVPDF